MTLKSADTIKQTNQMNYLYYGVSQIGAHFFTIIDRIGIHFTALFLMRCYMRKLNFEKKMGQTQKVQIKKALMDPKIDLAR